MKRTMLALLLLVSQVVSAKLSNELDCLAHNIYFESRNQPTPAQFAVGFVTMNRVKSNAFPNSICKVVKQKHQFSWFWDGLSDKPNEKEAYEKAKKIATLLLSGRFTDNTSGALFYHSNKVKPKWAEHFYFIAQYGDHLFYRYRNTDLKN